MFPSGKWYLDLGKQGRKKLCGPCPRTVQSSLDLKFLNFFLSLANNSYVFVDWVPCRASLWELEYLIRRVDLNVKLEQQGG